jgi:hypothetical protein
MQANLLLGEAGKYRVAAELLVRGIQVLFPAVDDGIDLFSGGNCLQVKAARLGSDGAYSFQFRHWVTRDHIRKQKHGRLHDGVTHVVLWAVNDDVFFVIPRTFFSKPPTTIRITSKGIKLRKTKYIVFVGAWTCLQNVKSRESHPASLT